MTNETQKKIEELIKSDDGSFANELEKAQSKEEFVAAFSAHGIELTPEDADELLKETLANEELSEEALEEVAGGMSFKSAVALGWGIGSRVGMIGRMVYDKYKYGNPYKNYNLKYSPCQGQSNLTPWKTATNHGRLQMPAIGG